LRVQLPSSNDCVTNAAQSVCSNTSLLNQLDGFSVNSRIMVCFSAPINTNTLQSAINILPLSGGSAIPVNQVVYDPNSNCAFAKPNQVLNQQSQYLLVVSGTIQDTAGKVVSPDPAFATCLASNTGYCQALAQAISASAAPLASLKVAIVSLFTTMSATVWVQNAHAYIAANPPGAAEVLGSFPLSGLTNITYVPSQSAAPPQALPLAFLGGVGSLDVGLFPSYDFLDPSNGSIPVSPTTSPVTPILPGVIPVSFHLFLPASTKPSNGYPVVIYGHGLGDTQFGASTYIASTLAQQGFATLGFEITGGGYGQGSTLNLTLTGGTVVPLPAPGRGILLPGNSTIGPTDGCILPGALAVRDCGRQTAADLFSLVKAIQQTPSLGLDATRIYYVGQSFGGTYGTLFHAVEPTVSAAVLNGDGGPSTDVGRLAISARSLGIEYLESLGLLNVPPASPETYFNDSFNDNYPFRDNPVLVNEVPGAMPIQAAFEAAEWLGMLGDPLSFAQHLKLLPLSGVPAKSVLFQFGLGDLEVPNPGESAVARTAGAQASTWYFRFDLASVAYGHPELLSQTSPDAAPLPILPHRILANPSLFGNDPAETSIALAEQNQVAAYFLSNGTANPNPNQYVTAPFTPAMQLFQVPQTLPDQLNFLQIPANPATVPVSSTSCNGLFNGVFQGNITLSSGQNCVFLSGGITGNLAANGGTAVLSGATLQGNLTVTGTGMVSLQSSTVNGNIAIQNMTGGTPGVLCGTTVKGNVAYQNNANPMQIGASSSCAPNTISGNLTIQNNAGATTVYGNTVSANLVIQNDTGATTVYGNAVSASLVIQNDTGATTVNGNTVKGSLVCQNNSAITGGSNTASIKQGQCAGF
jgi:dienelactone hydrolase